MKLFTASLACSLLLLNSVPVWAQQTKQPPPVKKEIGLWVAKDFAPSVKIRLEINTRNIPSLQLSVQELSDPVAWFLSERTDKPKPPAVKTKPVAQWTTSMLGKNDRPTPHQVDRYYSREVNLPKLQPGIYKVTARGEGVEQWSVVNVTNLAVIAKRSNYRTYVWVTDALKGNVLRNVQVAKYEFPFQKSPDKAVTGVDGMAKLSDNANAARIIITHKNDRALVELMGPWPGNEQRVHFQTDRPVYRPGQTVKYKAIVRDSEGAVWKSITNKPVQIEVRDSHDEVLDRQDTTTNAMGTVAGSFEIPSEAATGPYSLTLKRGAETAYSTFTVAEYRKPEYKVDIQPAAKRYFAGDDISYKLNASYYFGAPLQQAEVRYVVRRSSLPYWGVSDDDRWFYSGDGNLYARDEYGRTDVVTEDVAHTDEQGNVTLTVKSDPKHPDETYSISATVTDASRRQVEAATSVPVYAASIRIGIRSEMMFVSAGSLIPVEIAVRDLDGKPAAAKVELRTSHQEWNKQKKQYETLILDKTTVNVPANGKAVAKIPANIQGNVDIVATAIDSSGRVAGASMNMWVSGPLQKGEKEEQYPEVRIRLDRKSYKPGDTIKANITSSVKRGSPMLVMLEGEDIFTYAVLDAGSRSWNIKTTRSMSPNAYVTAAQWVDGQMYSANQIVPLPDESRLIKVTATPDKTNYLPGESITYRVHTADTKGNPIDAEVALGVIDAAIYGIRGDSTPDMVQFYWGMRGNRVHTVFTAPEEVSGGAFQRANPAAPVRQRFEETAYWNPFVMTGPDGEAVITFDLPDNLTSWKATARGITMDTGVGEGFSTVIASRPVMMRFSTPRQMVVGDELTIISSVNNRTDSSRDFFSHVNAEGVALIGPEKQNLTVGANAEGHLNWKFRVDALPASGVASLLGTTEPIGDKNADLSDALRSGFPITPKGVLLRFSEGGVTTGRTEATFTLPSDRIEPSTKSTIRVWAGLTPVVQTASDNVLNSYRYGPTIAADQLSIAALRGMNNSDKAVREALAMLSRTQVYGGWGWWEGGNADPIVTMQVLEAFTRAREAKIQVSDRLMSMASSSLAMHYNQTNLWDRKAKLAAALSLAKAKEGPALLDDVLRRGIKLSPYSRLKVAQALAASGEKTKARELVDEVLKDALVGPYSARIPGGAGLGWESNDIDTTAQALITLHALDDNERLQSKLASELARPSKYGWRSCHHDATVALALADHLKDHPESSKVGDLRVTINGAPVEMKLSKTENAASGQLARSVLKDSNHIEIVGNSGQNAFYQIDSSTYRPMLEVADSGLSVLRRIEVLSNNGVWHELRGDEPLLAGDAIRCTVLVWGRGERQPTRVTEPLPASFEYVQEGGASMNSRQQVRDGSVEHYVMTSSEPLHFTYYLRAESTGTVTALPATAELLRDPSVRGQSAAQVLTIQSK